MKPCPYMNDRRCTNKIALPIVGERPSPGVCQNCKYRHGMRGLGDLVYLIILFFVRMPYSKLRRKPIQMQGSTKGSKCGCVKRQEALNEAVPFQPKE